MRKKVGIIGNSAMAVRCMKHVIDIAEDAAEIVFVIRDPKIDGPSGAVLNFCQKVKVPFYEFDNINSEESVALIRQAKPDIIFSIINYQLIKEELLAIAPEGIINFHDGPLPAYRGLNISTWAIYNGEKEHGVTWHYVDLNIDSGDIVAQNNFSVDDGMTAGELMIRNMQQGEQLFIQFFKMVIYAQGAVSRFKQAGKSSYYSSKILPENDGIISFQWPFQKIDRLVRALNYFPYKNPFLYARMKSPAGNFIVNKVSYVRDLKNVNRPGSIIVEDNQFLVTCKDAIFKIDDLMDCDLKKIDPAAVAKGLSAAR